MYFGYSIPNNYMRQYTVNIRCMYDVTEGEINNFFVCLFQSTVTVVARLRRASTFCGTAILDWGAI